VENEFIPGEGCVSPQQGLARFLERPR